MSGQERVRDPIEMEVFSNRLLSITEDMNNTLVRSSFSTNIKERKDCSVALFDGKGRLVAQGTQIPLHLGSLNGAVATVLARYPLEDISDGDAFICNDPYLAAGSHLPDVNIVTPVFEAGRLVFFTANVGHHSDFGGVVAGSIAGGLRSIFAEGLRLPVIRIVRQGVLDEDLLNLIANNTRDPEERTLDLKVQIATNNRGSAAIKGLIQQMGLEKTLQAVDDIILYTRNRLLKRIGDLKPGSYTFENWLDDDGLGDGEPVPIRVKAIVQADRLVFDFSGSGPQARGAMNLPFNALNACVYYAVKALLDPELAANAGLFELISVKLPPASIVNPELPAAVGARSITAQKVAGAIFGAFRGVLPESQVMGAGNDVCPAIVFSGKHPRRAGEYVYLETVGGGSGATADGDGMDGIHVHMTNSSNLPVEALENEYPLRVEEYGYVQDSGGAGRYRGGMGLARQIASLAPGIVFTARSDSHLVGEPSGALGAQAGRRAAMSLREVDGTVRTLPSKASSIVLEPGQSIRIETPGGGGVGMPDMRAKADVLRDLADGAISAEAASKWYGGQLADEAVSELPAVSLDS
ncbi:hydantoinase B/oxoprolinase family protein [Allopusillimonas soli]|uniref:Hydantoinase B/oxoprolinase family protein n=1 Tax=Allopusillimonas soli TaxID=659016 RepID=A0A853F5J7_9BURK|nr:hydantoinase B/oxoprolinase family protein [Allopusillimonas soli]NYT35804.1 hydantoinase B/oxoprolinase family protein [Allopusillimonas soli]TEA76179.1 hydantoinase B/oxoprolinase family protein [Allopusillimonas soli]